MPKHFVPTKLRQETLLAARSGDNDTKASAVKSFLAQNARTILRVVDSYFMPGQDPSELDELTMRAATSVLEHIDKFSTNTPMPIQIHNFSKNAAASYVSRRDRMPLPLVLNPHYHVIVSTIEAVIGSNQRQLTAEKIDSLVEELAQETEASKDQIKEYIFYRNSINADNVPESLANDGDATWRTVQTGIKEAAVADALGRLKAGESYVLRHYFGFEGKEESLEKIGADIGLTRSRINRIWSKARRHLIHSIAIARKDMRPFIFSEQEAD